jgi:hypothetical protein
VGEIVLTRTYSSLLLYLFRYALPIYKLLVNYE